jgi:hypothetical protein
MRFIRNLKMDLPYDPAVLLLVIFQRNVNQYTREMCTPMFTTALCTITKLWIQCSCPKNNEQIKKMEYYSTVKKSKVNIVCRKMDGNVE